LNVIIFYFFCTGRRPEVLVHFARMPDAPAYPVLYATYGRTQIGSLQLKAWNLQL
jgi:hypothetical protein